MMEFVDRGNYTKCVTALCRKELWKNVIELCSCLDQGVEGLHHTQLITPQVNSSGSLLSLSIAIWPHSLQRLKETALHSFNICGLHIYHTISVTKTVW